jgi:hypothetical protein
MQILVKLWPANTLNCSNAPNKNVVSFMRPPGQFEFETPELNCKIDLD